MKKIFYLLFIIFLNFSCNSDKKNLWEIQGELTNSNDETIFLKHLKNEKIVIFDSTKITNGKFHFKDTSSKSEYLFLEISQFNNTPLLIEPNNKLIFKSDAKNLKNYDAKGSKNIELVCELNSSYNELLEKLDTFFTVYEKKLSVKKVDSVKTIKEFKDSLDIFIKKHQDYLINFVEKNINSPSSYFALMQRIDEKINFFSINEHIDLLKKVDKSLYEKYKDFDLAKNLHNFLMRYEMMEEQKQASQRAEEDKKNPIKIGDMAKDISYKNPDGKEISLFSLKGKYVLLDFWASWCKPCRIENPHLVKVYKKYKDKDFEIYQVSLDKDKKSWLQGIKDDNLGSWIHVSDLKYWSSEPAAKYKVRSIPSNFLLDKNGRIIAMNLRAEELEKKISEVLNKK